MEVSKVKKATVGVLAALVTALSLATGAATAPTQSTSLTIYSGREDADGCLLHLRDLHVRDTLFTM